VLAAVRLEDGRRASLEIDEFDPTLVTLVLDGHEQSQLDPTDATRLPYEYVRRIGTVLDLAAPAGQPVTALHLGAGALTLPRYLAATRPGSSQTVVELDGALARFVLEELPMVAAPTAVVGDARAALAGLAGPFDVIVVDVFSGGAVPRRLAEPGFFREVAALLAPGGLVAVNAPVRAGAAIPELTGLRAALPHVAAFGAPSVLEARLAGNAVLVGSGSPFGDDRVAALRAAGPHPASVDLY
jgi:spermidine synthase